MLRVGAGGPYEGSFRDDVRRRSRCSNALDSTTPTVVVRPAVYGKKEEDLVRRERKFRRSFDRRCIGEEWAERMRVMLEQRRIERAVSSRHVRQFVFGERATSGSRTQRTRSIAIVQKIADRVCQ